MTPYEKEVVYTMRSPEGTITSVFDPMTNKYLRVVDTAITIDSSAPNNVDVEEAIKQYAKRKGAG